MIFSKPECCPPAPVGNWYIKLYFCTMFIKPYQKHNRTTNERYSVYKLVEGYRYENYVRHRVIVNFGKLEEFKTDDEIKLLGRRVEDMLKKAKAFVYAAEEDFGIVPLEAQACGTPVIAYGKGGALETVMAGETGIFFYEQTEAALIDAVNAFEMSASFDPDVIRRNAERFNKDRFLREIEVFVKQKAAEFFGKSSNLSDV